MSLLSERGVARREAGLEALKVVVRRRGRRRVVVRAAGAVVVIAAAGLGALLARGGGTGVVKVTGTVVAAGKEVTTGAAVQGETVPGRARVTMALLAGIGLVRTDPRVVSECAPSAGRVARLDDAGLQRALREAGEPAGLVRIGKRVMVEGELGKGGEGM